MLYFFVFLVLVSIVSRMYSQMLHLNNSPKNKDMTLIERLLIVVILFVMASCSIKETNEGESLGELALGVFSVTSDADKFNTNLAIIVVLKHEESGFIHNIEVDFKEGRRLVYVKNLRPGLYTALEYRYGAHKGDDPIFNYPLELSLIHI